MATVDEILTRQAYAAGDGTWTEDNNYPSYTLYVEPEYVPVTNKRIADFNDQISVRGEQNARFVGFQMPRYDDGQDLMAAHLYIHYQTVYGGSDSVPCNVSWSDNYIRLCWQVPAQATQEPDRVQMMIYATGTNSAGERVTWKTLPASYTIHDGLDIGGGIPEPDPSWYEQFVAQMEGKVSIAQGYANDAQASKTAAAGSAAESAQSAAASAKALEDNRAYVESQKETFVGYNKRETDLKYANALIGTASGMGRVTVGDAWEAPIPDLEIAGMSGQFSTTGAQMLDCSKLNKSAGGAVVNYGDGGYTISGTGTLTGAFSASYQLDYLKNHLMPGNLILKSDPTVPKLYVRIWNGSTILAEMQGNSTKQITREMLDNDNIRIECFLHGNAGSTITPGTYHPMLYQSGDGTWEPYTGGKPSPSPEYPQEIVGTDVTSVMVTGAQLLDANLLKSATALGVTFTNNGDGSFTTNGTATEYPNIRAVLLLPPGTYIASGAQGETKFFVRILSSETDYLDYDNTPFVITGNEYMVQTYIQVNKDRTASETIWPMINAGPTALPWQPYQSSTVTIPLTEPLRGIGDVRDRIMCRDGVWGVERQFVSLTFDGSENWLKSETNVANKSRFRNVENKSIIKAEETSKIPIKILCDRLKAGCSSDTYRPMECISSSTSGDIYVYLEQFDTGDVDAFKAYLSAHPLNAMFERATPTWEPLPSATQSALNALTTYTGTTHVTVTAGGPEPDVGLGYVQDTRAVIADIMAQINEIRGGTT